MLAYNLSPSFNWDASGMTDRELARFNDDLGKLGYAWQFITLAGFHSNGLVVTKLSRSYANEGMLAYVRDIQRQRRWKLNPYIGLGLVRSKRGKGRKC